MTPHSKLAPDSVPAASGRPGSLLVGSGLASSAAVRRYRLLVASALVLALLLVSALALAQQPSGTTRGAAPPQRVAPSSEGSAPRQPAAARGTTRALVVGIDRYRGGGLPDLTFAGADARSVADTLRRMGHTVDLVLDATQRDFEAAIDRLRREIGPDDTALLYFAGHGVRQDGRHLLLMADARPQSASSKSAPNDLREVLAQLSRAPARRRIALIDTCATDEFPSTKPSSKKNISPPAQFDRPIERDSFVLFSTSAGQCPSEDTSARTSSFTRALIEALQPTGRSMEEVARYVLRRVTLLSGGQQIPEFVSSLSNDYCPNGGCLAAERPQSPPAGTRSAQATAPASVPIAPQASATGASGSQQPSPPAAVAPAPPQPAAAPEQSRKPQAAAVQPDQQHRDVAAAEAQLAVLEKTLGPDHPDVATALFQLAEMDGVQGRLVDAEPLYRRALAIREEALGPEHPDVASVLVGLAQLHRAQGRLSDAEPLYRRAIAIQQKAVGPNHPSVRALVDNLAAVTEQLRRQAEAEATKPTGPGKAAEPAPTPSAPPVSVAAAAPRAPALSFGALRHLLPVLTIGAGAGLLALLLVGGRRPRALALLAGVPLVAGAATHGLHSAASHVLGPATGLALTHLTVSPDGRFIASADVRGRLVIRDTSGVLPDHVAEHGSNRVRAVGFYSSLDDGGDRYFASVVEGVDKGVERFQATATAWQTVGSVSSGSTLAWPIALCWPLSMPTAVYSPRPAAKPVGSSSSFRRL